MALDETLFGAVFGAWRRLRGTPGPPEHPEAVVLLEDVKDRVRVVASGLLGHAVTVQAAEGAGGLAGNTLLVPARIAVCPRADLNKHAYLWRAVLASQLHRFRPPAGMESGAALLCVMPRLLQWVRQEMPLAAGWFEDAAPFVLQQRGVEERTSPWELVAQLVLGASSARMEGDTHPASWAWANVAFEHLERGAWPLPHPPPPPRRGWLPAPPVLLWGSIMAHQVRPPAQNVPEATGATGTERQGKPRERVVHAKLSEDPEEENPLVHSFEKVHTAEEHQGGTRRADGDDDMEQQGNALDELDLRKVVQSSERTRSVYRADVLLEGARGEVGGPPDPGGIPYDEWDHVTGTYRRRWCQLHERLGHQVPAREAKAWARVIVERHRRSVEDLERAFARMASLRRWRGRMPDGPDVDLDAMVDRHASLCAGTTPDPRLFGDCPRAARSAAMLLLLDNSLSTDSHVEGHRVLEVARDSVVVLGEALGRLAVPVGVAAFHSHTRRDCRYVGLKGFAEGWDAAHQRLKPLVPEGYTRMGPALRHATAVLARQPAHRRLLVLLSDAKPTDHDAYEGRQGIEDVRQAVREAEAARVHVFALAVDVRARHHLPRLFGPSNYRVLAHPSQLPAALAAVQARLLR